MFSLEIQLVKTVDFKEYYDENRRIQHALYTYTHYTYRGIPQEEKFFIEMNSIDGASAEIHEGGLVQFNVPGHVPSGICAPLFPVQVCNYFDSFRYNRGRWRQSHVLLEYIFNLINRPFM